MKKQRKAFRLYRKLDEDDRLRIIERMMFFLENEKYIQAGEKPDKGEKIIYVDFCEGAKA